MDSRYGREQDIDLLSEELAKVDYPGLEIGHLLASRANTHKV